MTGRIVIIGTGAIGMTAASELATRATGAEIVIIGPRNRTGGDRKSTRLNSSH